MALLRVLIFLPRLLLLIVVGSALYLVALVFVSFGRGDLLATMRPTLVRWHFLDPKTPEERWDRAVSEVNLSARLHGMSKREFILFLLRRTLFGRRRMTQFFEEKAKTLTSHLPNIIRNLATGDDLAMVIASSQLLDEYLGLIIVTRFHVAITKKNWERAFTFEGPLGSFGSKISMGIVLGLVIGDMINDLTYLKKIRNGFAHAIGRQFISDEVHAKWARKLKMKVGLSEEVRARCSSDEARQYLESVAANIMYLSVLLNRALAEKSFVIEHVGDINARAAESVERVRANAHATPGVPEVPAEPDVGPANSSPTIPPAA